MWSASPILALVAALLVPSASWVAVEAEDTAWRLLWKNGDILPGRPLESGPGEVRWASPPFADALTIDPAALDAIVFPEKPVEPVEAHRVRMVSGDVLVADLVGVDDNAFVFDSRRHGRVRVDRDMVYTLDRRRHPSLLFDGSQLRHWSLQGAATTGAPGGRVGLLASNWEADAEGHPHTDRPQAEMHHALDWPERFELAVEFTSTERPGFALALGRGVNQALRLETWGDDLMVAQGRLFERVLTVQEGQTDVRLRLAFDARAGAVTVHDMGGHLLAELSDVQPLEKNAGLTIRSRGRDLTVKLLRAYRHTGALQRQPADRAKPRVHTIDGQVIYGRLSGDDEGVYVLDEDGNRRDVDLGDIDRIVRPDIELGAEWGPGEVTYPDGSVLRGWVERLNGRRVTLRTAFADTPVGAALAGASRLSFGSRSDTTEGEGFGDQLFHSSGKLRGRLSFGENDGALLWWQVTGGIGPTPLAFGGETRIQRGLRDGSTAPYDREAYPDVLRLKSREIIACKVVSADEEQVEFRSPFVEARAFHMRHIKAIELSPGPIAGRANSGASPDVGGTQGFAMTMTMTRMQHANDAGGLQAGVVVRFNGPGGEARVVQFDGDVRRIRVDDGMIIGLDADGNIVPRQGVATSVDKEALERALTVPRFLRNDPPTHVLVAKNGDLLRGRLLGIDDQAVHFESKLRGLHIPIDRVARVVDVTKPEKDADADSVDETEDTIRVTLAGGSSLVFTPLASIDGELTGRSAIYGAVTVRVDDVDHVRSGRDAAARTSSIFAEWVVRPGKEPVFGSDE